MAESLISINVDKEFKKQADVLRRNLTQRQQNAFYYRLAQKVGVVAEGEVADPPVRRARPLPRIYRRTLKSGKTIQSKFKSMKQQGKVFALIKEGAIPYTRGQGKSERLLQSISSRVESSGGSYRVIVGTDVSYGALVKGDPDTEQAPIHQGVWSPLSEDVGNDEAVAKYETVIGVELQAYVDGLLGQ